MKVVCEYCGSYVEADENMKCPSCLAELGSAVRAEQARIEQQEAAEREAEAAERAQEAKDEHVSDVIKGVASVATALVAGVAGSNAATSGERHARLGGGRPVEPPEGGRMHARPDEAGGFMGHARMGGPGGHGGPGGGHGGPGGPGGGRR